MSSAAETARAGSHTVTITVNHKPVDVEGPRLDGRDIKQAAIDQGLPITLDFVLSEIRPNGRPRIIGNDDKVTVNKNSAFTAIADDDDS